MKKLREFIKFISDNDGIGNKQNLILKANEQFELIKDRTIYYCDSFAVRFSYSSKTGFSNTVLSLSKLQKFDNVPVLVCFGDLPLIVVPMHKLVFTPQALVI